MMPLKKSTLQIILDAFGLKGNDVHVKPLGTGLINSTWKLQVDHRELVLQRINEQIFQHPQLIADNIRMLSNYVQEHHPLYNFIAPIKTLNDEELLLVPGEGSFRLFPFVKDSHTIDVVESPQQAFEAARQFGRFAAMFSGMDPRDLHATIPFFHDLSLRYQQFEEALQQAGKDRLHAASPVISKLKDLHVIVDQYQLICQDPNIKKRITHHDTKISNVLFNDRDEGLCVIDLDTVMPGYFISDVGDMMRTYLCPASEEETDVGQIHVRDEMYRAIMEGYLGEMKTVLSPAELDHFYFSGEFIIYMQALRFLTDYLNHDKYYGARYTDHNLNRATNQLVLLEKCREKKWLYQQMCKSFAG